MICAVPPAAASLHAARDDAGFTLVEVLVAFLIIAIIAAAGTSLTIRGMRATLDAKQLSQAKNLVNEQIEQMRGLPYFVANTTSAAPVDVLDRYYPNTDRRRRRPTARRTRRTWLREQDRVDWLRRRTARRGARSNRRTQLDDRRRVLPHRLDIRP